MNQFNLSLLLHFEFADTTGQQQGRAGGNKGRTPAKPVSAEDLDAELDAYVNDMKL